MFSPNPGCVISPKNLDNSRVPFVHVNLLVQVTSGKWQYAELPNPLHLHGIKLKENRQTHALGGDMCLAAIGKGKQQ
jgi:hypothetical protein